MPGFRKGKVPPQMVLQRIGRDAVMEEALESSREWYERAMIDSGVTPVGDPKLDMPDPPAEGEPLEFTIEVGVRPRRSSASTRGSRSGVPSPKCPRRRSTPRSSGCARASPASRPSSGRPATATSSLIDYAGEIDGEPFEGGAATDFLLELGSETLIELQPGLDGSEPATRGRSRSPSPTSTRPSMSRARRRASRSRSRRSARRSCRSSTTTSPPTTRTSTRSAELRADIREVAAAAAGQIARAVPRRGDRRGRRQGEIEIPEEIVQARATRSGSGSSARSSSRGWTPTCICRSRARPRRDDRGCPAGRRAGLKREAVLAAVADAEEHRGDRRTMLEALGPAGRREGQAGEVAEADPRAEGRDALFEEIRMRKAPS